MVLDAFGVVWNNSKWYVGMSTILHAYNIVAVISLLITSLEVLNLYAGFNFGRKKEKIE